MSIAGLSGTARAVERAAGAVRRHLGWAIAATYLLAAVLPGPGVWLRHAHAVPTSSNAILRVHPAPILLALMLFTAVLQVPTASLTQMLRRPGALFAGVAAHLAAPLLILPGVILMLRWLPDADHGAGLLGGLVVVAAMPVAAGATVWVGRGHGDQSAMVGLVVASTLISPLSVPLTITTLSALLDDAVADALESGARTGARCALLAVLLPCVAGIACRIVLPQNAAACLVRACLPSALIGSLALTYSNAAGALGSFLSHPNLPLIVTAIVLAAAVCAFSFAVGCLAARLLRLKSAQAASVTLACGMSNSSAGAVLVSSILPSRPHELLPVLAYSLIQKLAAGRITRRTV